jgi:pimeloyl-ACP methyl ester carboxylesterase
MPEIVTADGHALAFLETGAPDGQVLVKHHGAPGSGGFYRSEVDSAKQRGLRLIAYDRPGYGGSTARRDRTVADAAADVAALLDVLGVDRFATYGWSGGGPHALACAALLPDRCAGAATLAGVGPADAPDLDWMSGMGEGNVAEFAAAREGRERLTEYCIADAAGITEAGADGIAEALRPHLSEVDARALTGDVAEFMYESITHGVRSGVAGWVDDDYAFLAPWGFDVGAIAVPVLVWQGQEDLMVPAAHGDWLQRHVRGAEGGILPGEGHLTLVTNRIGDVHAWLQECLA